MFGAATYLCPAHARADQAAFRVEYRSAEGCPTSEAFTNQLLARSRMVRPAVGAEAALVISVELGQADKSFVGKLRLLEVGGRITERVVPGPTCDEVVSALALVAAVLVDPEADRGASPTVGGAPGELEPDGTKPGEEVPADGKLKPLPAPPPSKPIVGPRPEPAPAKQPAATPSAETPPEGSDDATSSPRRIRVGAGVGAVLEGAVAPGAILGVSVEATVGFERPGVLSPLLALAFVRTTATDAETPAGTARLSFNAARLMLCPVRWPTTGALTARACGSFEGGLLHARGFDTLRQDESDTTWWATGVFLRLEARPRGPFSATLDGGLVVPFSRDRFYFDPDNARNTAFEVPAVAGSGRVGLSFVLD